MFGSAPSPAIIKGALRDVKQDGTSYILVALVSHLDADNKLSQ
jgi:hypothetical protein